MIHLYYADFSSVDPAKLIPEYSSKIDPERLQKVMRTKADSAKVRSLIAGYLLQVGVKRYLKENRVGSAESMKTFAEAVLPLRYRYTDQGKPYLADYPDLYFNLSHSGNVAVCAVADCEVGMDVQVYGKGREAVAKRFFTGQEQEMLQRAKEEGRFEEVFFSLWSIKESYLKYTGLGMKMGLDSFDIDFDSQRIIGLSDKEGAAKQVYFRQISLPNLSEYAVSVCCGCEKMEIMIHQVPV
ncbi:MAG: 4'-phosphopantetheinyl transferase superfamily protein [Lachnospiraceae bacterium]|nr:4'-phosphopantetheinyl transferase superfamily protein [Lachnospiraceae bacterium]